MFHRMRWCLYKIRGHENKNWKNTFTGWSFWIWTWWRWRFFFFFYEQRDTGGGNWTATDRMAIQLFSVFNLHTVMGALDWSALSFLSEICYESPNRCTTGEWSDESTQMSCFYFQNLLIIKLSVCCFELLGSNNFSHDCKPLSWSLTITSW